MVEFQMNTTQSNDSETTPRKPQKKSSFSSAAPNPSRPVRYLVHARRQNRSKSNVAFVEEETDQIDETETEPPRQETNYGSLAHIQSIKPSFTPDDKSLPKKVRYVHIFFSIFYFQKQKNYNLFREYYEDQLELITSIEDILLAEDDNADHATSYEKRQKKMIKILTMTTLIINIVCYYYFFN